MKRDLKSALKAKNEALFDVPVYKIGPENLSNTCKASSWFRCLCIILAEILNPLESTSFSISRSVGRLNLKRFSRDCSIFSIHKYRYVTTAEELILLKVPPVIIGCGKNK